MVLGFAAYLLRAIELRWELETPIWKQIHYKPPVLDYRGGLCVMVQLFRGQGAKFHP